MRLRTSMNPRRHKPLRFSIEMFVGASFVLSLIAIGVGFTQLSEEQRQLAVHTQSIRKSGDSSRSSSAVSHASRPEQQQTWKDCHAPQWAVATTIFEVNSAVEHLVSSMQENDFCLVVVGDLKTDDAEWEAFQDKHPSVVYLSPTRQKQMDYAILQHIPWNHFGRKSIACLYAVAHGAQFIYDFDDDNHLQFDSFEEPLRHMQVYELETDHHVFNPYPYYRSSHAETPVHVWPRGFPLQFVNDEAAYDPRLVRETEEEKLAATDFAVLQSLADHDPDVDAIYRMTQQLPVFFHKANTVIKQPPNVYMPYNAQATFFRPGGFFGLLLPVTVPGRVSDIWRSYITQRLVWETHECVGFSSPVVAQYRNPHSYMVDLVEENDLYYRVDELMKILSGWTTNKFATLDAAYLDLMKLLVDQKIFLPAEFDLAQAWVKDLDKAGYQWPAITNRQKAFVPRTAPIVDQRDETKKPPITEQRAFSQAQHDETTNLCDAAPLSLETATHLKKSAVCTVRKNSKYDHSAGLRRMLALFDEVVLVDINTPSGKRPVLEELHSDIKQSPRLVTVVMSPEECERNFGKSCEDDEVVQSLALSLGVPAASGEIVGVAANCRDLVPPNRDELNELIRSMPTWRHTISLRGDELETNEETNSILSTVHRLPKRLTCSSKIAEYDSSSTSNNKHAFDMAHKELWKKMIENTGEISHTGRDWLHTSWLKQEAVIQTFDTKVLFTQTAAKKKR